MISRNIILLVACGLIIVESSGCATPKRTIESDSIQEVAKEPMGLKSLPLKEGQEIHVLSKLGIIVGMKITEIDKTKISGFEMTLPNNEITSNSFEIKLEDIESISFVRTEKYVTSGNYEEFPNCDFGTAMKRNMKGVWRNDPIGFITSSVGIPIMYTAMLPVYLSAKSSETSGCEKLAFMKFQQHRFATVAKDNLTKDMAQGSGEYIYAMAYLQGCPASTYIHYADITHNNLARIFPEPETKPEEILSNLQSQIEQDPLLSSQCKWVS